MTEQLPAGATEPTEQLLDEQQHFKTLGVRIEEAKHAQLRFIAHLTGSSIADEIRRAIDGHIETAQADEDLMARADTIRAEMEREAEARRSAIAGFFGKQATSGAAAPGTRGSRQTGKTTGREGRS